MLRLYACVEVSLLTLDLAALRCDRQGIGAVVEQCQEPSCGGGIDEVVSGAFTATVVHVCVVRLVSSDVAYVLCSCTDRLIDATARMALRWLISMPCCVAAM
jgi:hypothetical protein